MISSTNAINATFYENLNFNFASDIAPVASLYRNSTFVIVVNPLFPAKTLPEFIAYAKAHPGKVNMGSAGVGTPGHVYLELFKIMTGVDLVHVPYRGQPQVLTDLLGGQIQVTFDPLANSIGHIRAGRLRALAVTRATRSLALPDIPTVGEFVPGYEASGWQGIGAPKSTPREIIEMLNHEVAACLADAKMTKRFEELGDYTPFATSPAELAKFIAEETEKWAKVIRAANIRAK
jgi:tripartite-type tricarboxylate transporter receptor subunit TctC